MIVPSLASLNESEKEISENGEQAMLIIGVKHSSAVRDDWLSASALASKNGSKRRERKGLFTPPVQSHGTGPTRGCVVVSEAACMFECMPVCLHVCTNHPSTSGSLGCRLAVQP